MKLTLREEQVRKLRFEKHYTLLQIAEELGITIARAQQIVKQVIHKQDELTYEEIISLIDSRIRFGRPRIYEYELVAIRKCLVKYYELSKRVE